MFAGIGVSRMRCAISIGLLLTMIAVAGETLAQDAPSADPTGSSRERELRDQLNNILKELEDIQQQKESAKPEAERPSIIKEKEEAVSSEATAEAVPAAGPDFDLADMSIVEQAIAETARRDLVIGHRSGGDRFSADSYDEGIAGIASGRRLAPSQRTARLQHHDPWAGREDHIRGS